MPPKHLTLAILLLAFTAHSGDSTITYANKTYKTAKIGTQTWLAENLNYEAEGSVCYENNPANCAKYGRLYNWETAMKVCPEGWHLPSDAEWDKLYRFVDGDTGTESPYDSKTAGKYLKAKSGWHNEFDSDNGCDYWNEGGDCNGIDNYDFSALPGGYGASSGGFYEVGYGGGWWSASGYDKYGAYRRDIYFYDGASLGVSVKSYLYSVRCIKD